LKKIARWERKYNNDEQLPEMQEIRRHEADHKNPISPSSTPSSGNKSPYGGIRQGK